MQIGSKKGAGALACCFAALVSSAQGIKFCEGELGTAPWACEAVSPVNPGVYSAAWLPVPNAAPGNPVMYQQIASGGAAKVFVLTDGSYQCMLAESCLLTDDSYQCEAALFDAPEG